MIRFALIGLGSMGRNHYRLLKTMADVRLVAVCDPVLQNGLPERIHNDIQGLLASERIDAAIVSVPTTHHKAVATTLAEHGIPFLLEKPIAPSVNDALEIIRAVEDSGVPTAVGHVERFNPVIDSLLDQLVGRNIYSISITRVGPFPPRIKDVGVLVDLSVHDIDIVRLLAGDVELAECRVFKSVKTNGYHEDNAVLSLRFENEMVASIITNWLTPFKKRQVEVATDKAYYEADLVAQELNEYSAYQEDGSYIVRQCRVHKSEPLANELRAFVHFLRSGNRGRLATLEDGLRTLEIIHRKRMMPV